MSLATRCPACGTIFRVVQDQLKVSEGWVRCGQCHEVFHGIEALFDLDSDPAIAARRAARGNAPVAPSTRVFAENRANAPIPAAEPPAAIVVPSPPAQRSIPQTPSPVSMRTPLTPATTRPALDNRAPPPPGFTPASSTAPTHPIAPAPAAARGTIAPRFAARLAEESARAQAAPAPSPIPSAFPETMPPPVNDPWQSTDLSPLPPQWPESEPAPESAPVPNAWQPPSPAQDAWQASASAPASTSAPATWQDPPAADGWQPPAPQPWQDPGPTPAAPHWPSPSPQTATEPWPAPAPASWQPPSPPPAPSPWQEPTPAPTPWTSPQRAPEASPEPVPAPTIWSSSPSQAFQDAAPTPAPTIWQSPPASTAPQSLQESTAAPAPTIWQSPPAPVVPQPFQAPVPAPVAAPAPAPTIWQSPAPTPPTWQTPSTSPAGAPAPSIWQSPPSVPTPPAAPAPTIWQSPPAPVARQVPVSAPMALPAFAPMPTSAQESETPSSLAPTQLSDFDGTPRDFPPAPARAAELAENFAATPVRQPRTIVPKAPEAPTSKSPAPTRPGHVPTPDIGGSTIPSMLADEPVDDEEARAGPPTLASLLPEDAGEWPPRKGRKARDAKPKTPKLESQEVDEHRFLREAKAGARWRRPWVRAGLSVALVVLVVSAAGQLAWPMRDTLASRFPDTMPVWTWLCDQADCRIEPPRSIASLALDGSSLNRTDTEHVLLFSADLHNRADHEVRMPSFDLTFMDINGEIVSRKVLSPGQIGIHQASLAPEAELHVHARIQVGSLDASGFQAELFYP